MNKIFEQITKKRNFTPDFLAPKYEQLTDPYVLNGMKEAIQRIQQAIKQQEKILIYGDYDADGVTASTLMEQTLVLAGVQPDHIQIMLPNRFTDGYGMGSNLVKEAKKQGINLVITVDCGSRNHEIVDQLKAANIDTVITDHHETDAKMPNAIAVINPKRQDHPTPELSDLAGVGVAFKLAQALVKEGLIPEGQEKWLLDLVLIGTICDSMNFNLENRILGYYGLIVLGKTRRPGLKELMRTAKIKSLHSDAVGFQLGPRINAAGRLATADLSLNLLRAQSAPEAATFAEQLEQLNQQRKTEQNLAIREIKQRGVLNDPVIVETGEWHEGIVGIVAGRLVEDYQRPAFVLTTLEDGALKGSGRSFGDFNLAEALTAVKDTIVGGGGHAGAAGVRVDSGQLKAFRTKINEYYRSLNLRDQAQFFQQQPDLTLDDFSDLTLDLLDDLKSLEPYGPGNEEPLFRLRGCKIQSVTRMGADQNHLRLDLLDQGNRRLKLISFFAPPKWLDITPNTKIEPLVRFNENIWNGTRSLEATIVDIAFPDQRI